MRKVLLPMFVLAIVIIALTSYKNQEEKNYSLATVYSIEGKYIFLSSQPYYEYDTVFMISTAVMSNNPATATKAVIKKAIKEAEKRGVDFDGVLTGPAQRDYAIKFKK